MFTWLINLFKPRINTVEQLVKRVGIGNYSGLGEWMEFNIWYTRDNPNGSDEWKTPDRTLKDRTGDCEDFAVLAYTCLKLMNTIDVKIISVHVFDGSQVGHAICCFTINSKWYYYTNGELRVGGNDFKTMIEKVYKECSFSSLPLYLERDVNGNTIKQWSLK